MPKCLSPAQIEQYREEGCVSQIRVMSETEAAGFRGRLEAFERRTGVSTYWGLSKPDVVTAWVAFTEATEANGAMEYIPGSHQLDQIPHRDTFANTISGRAARR